MQGIARQGDSGRGRRLASNCTGGASGHGTGKRWAAIAASFGDERRTTASREPGAKPPPMSPGAPVLLAVAFATRSVSRILARVVIYLGRRSPGVSSNQPGRSAGRLIPPLFGLAAGGVYLADRSPGRRCALAAPFHPYRARPFRRHAGLAPAPRGATRRFDFCGTFPGVAPAGRYPAPCPTLFGLSSNAALPHRVRDHSTGSHDPPHVRIVQTLGSRNHRAGSARGAHHGGVPRAPTSL